MAEVFAGFVSGYLVALISTPLLAMLLLRLRASDGFLARLLPEGVGAVSLGMILHGGLFIYWTGLGMVLGLVLMAMPDGQGGFGSLSLPFTLMVFSLVVGFFAPVIIVMRPARLFAGVCAVSVLLIFGWLMPHMATWSRFDSPPETPQPYWVLPQEDGV